MLEKLEQCEKVAIVGLGLTGFSCACYLSSVNKPFFFLDTREEPLQYGKFKAQFPEAEFFLGERSLNAACAMVDLLVVSPGIALSDPVVTSYVQQGARITSDIELFRAEVNVPIIAVTGSNGKSTVVSLIAHILQDTGKKVTLAGNIGVPVLQTLQESYCADVIVLELSSFQLERLDALNADVACVLNISEDHMDRYDSFDDYKKAKLSVYKGTKKAVYNSDDAMTHVSTFERDTFTFGSTTNSSFCLKNEHIVYQGESLLSRDALRLKGTHNLMNVMAAFACCFPLGISLDDMCQSVKSFDGIKHRCQWLGAIDGVDYYNDSKGTNVGATLAAIQGLTSTRNIILIAGGKDKGSDFSELSETVQRHVKQLILIGDCAEKMAAMLTIQAQFLSSLEAAVVRAHALSEDGDIVLLSPACASFDMFDSFENRGDVFIEQVEKIREAAA